MFKLQINEVKLVSAVGIDYSKLRNLLAAKKWQEADEETTKLMLRAAKCEEKGWLDRESIEEFPCEDLHTIDQLWEEYSNGHFGFSVQNRIYQSLGGNNEYDSDVWETFRYIVGWLKKGERLYYNDLTFSEKAPAAHLPVVGLFVGFVGKGIKADSFDGQCALMAGLGGVVFDALASRILNCNQSVPVLPE
ncbi:MAG: GUN4 domain-containing protein [Microcoleus anatoxicus]|uniref:GUN4 domain-containing protein n=1 Tax=Microcoleus anatoxicus TaxID=2705319 RepID=UPI003672CAB4